jgi:hypothetical protein
MEDIGGGCVCCSLAGSHPKQVHQHLGDIYSIVMHGCHNMQGQQEGHDNGGLTQTSTGPGYANVLPRPSCMGLAAAAATTAAAGGCACCKHVKQVPVWRTGALTPRFEDAVHLQECKVGVS